MRDFISGVRRGCEGCFADFQTDRLNGFLDWAVLGSRLLEGAARSAPICSFPQKWDGAAAVLPSLELF